MQVGQVLGLPPEVGGDFAVSAAPLLQIKGEGQREGRGDGTCYTSSNRDQTDSGEDRGPGMQPRETQGRLGGLSYHIVFLVQPPAHEYG